MVDKVDLDGEQAGSRDILVSVIVPNYQHASFLECRLESIFRQTYANYEVILLDDASTDGSQEMLTRYARYHSKVSACVLNEQNSGSPFLQWRKGLSLARGQLVWIAESDDWAEENFLEECVRAWQRHPGVHIVSTYAYWVDAQGRREGLTRDWLSAIDGPEAEYRSDGRTFLQQYMLGKNHLLNASGIVFRKPAPPPEEFVFSLRYAGDRAFWISLLMTGDVVYLRKPLNNFRRHADAHTLQYRSHAGWDRIREQIAVMHWVRQTVPGCREATFWSRHLEDLFRKWSFVAGTPAAAFRSVFGQLPLLWTCFRLSPEAARLAAHMLVKPWFREKWARHGRHTV
jgi:glycosyltransferase involved in cell wall biosynthesis